MNAFLAFLRIDLKLAMRNRAVLFFNYLFPMMFFFIFGYAFDAKQGGTSVIVVTMVTTIGVLGTVAGVGYAPSARWDHPDALIVRLGRSGSRLIRIAASEVRDVIPAERKVVLANAFAFADETRRHLAAAQ